MVTPLDRPLRRAVTINNEPYVVTLDPAGLRVVRKGRRKGIEVPWQDVLSGGLTLGAQLIGSLQQSGADSAKRSPAATPRRGPA